ncbi:hypothetical protein LTR53_005417 [Teratosphaeriaceae sp. CCFEE 6253]|nr:hypothetical protein LTR53_005417 [Teratosphaeriaceae sp. CCFEE 6253]
MDPTYFTCTLGQAAGLGIQQPHKTINDLVDALAAEHPDLPAVGFPQPGQGADEPWTDVIFTFKDIKFSSESVATILLNNSPGVLAQRSTVGLLCPSTPEFLITWLALMRLGHAVLLIAPQCPAAAVASLCKTCDAGVLFHDDTYRDLAQDSRTASGGELEIAGLPLPDITSIEPLMPTTAADLKLPGVSIEENDALASAPSFPSGKAAATLTTTPLYHGGIADLFRAWTSHATIWLFPGRRAPITAINIVKCLDITQQKTVAQNDVAPVRYFSSVPYVLQMMEADPRGLQYLREMDIVGVGGAALPAEVGDRLVSHGVNLISRFGSAECGFLLSSHRDYSTDKEWQYLRVASGAEEYIRFEPQPDSDGLAELVVLKGWPHMAKRNREDGSYATSDLFAAHPSIPGAWRYHSRADSQLTLITGKKFDPAPVEASLATSELLDDVLIFGNGQPYPGALLFRSPSAGSLKDEDLLEQIWPSVEKMNAETQDHARLPRAMLVPMPVLEKPLEKSSKGTILRAAAEKRFASEIDQAYAKEDDNDEAVDVSDEQLPEFIKEVVSSVKSKSAKLTETTDLFSYGVDSIAGMQIRGKLRRLLRPDSKPLPINVVEDCGTVERLAEYVRRRRRGEADVDGTPVEDDSEYMRSLVEKYSNFRDAEDDAELTNRHSSRDNTGDTIVLTGATGALGAHVLDQYRQEAGVKKIYCLVRGADAHAAHERVNKALTQRRLQPLGSPSDEDKVVVLQAALGEAHLGLSDETYERLASEATIIMHVAWSVNFRMRLRSFVKDNIAGITHLINLALASPRPSPPRFAFCSSVASAMAYSGEGPVPERIIDDTSAATDLGYSQSKWVAEQICHRASETPRLRGRVSIFRVGQLAGDTVHGCWNTKEAWPMMLSAVKVTGALPALEDESLDWLPVDVAATALIQGAEAPVRDGTIAVYHTLNNHDRPSWMEMLDWFKKREPFDVVAPAEWVTRLEAAVIEGSDHPASQLLDHWKRAYVHQDGETAPVAKVRFDMAHTTAALPVLLEVRPVDEAYFGRLWDWIRASM